MTSGPVVVQVLEGENAVLRYREIMGATNPANARRGTIRKEVRPFRGENSVHGSDSPENAAIEIAQFFSGNEIVGDDAAHRRGVEAGPRARLQSSASTDSIMPPLALRSFLRSQGRGGPRRIHGRMILPPTGFSLRG